MEKSPQAFRTISEVAQWLETPAHVLRFWESRFPEIAPVKRAGGRRYYRPEDMRLLGGIKHLLHSEGHTIKSVQDRLKSDGLDAVSAFSQPLGKVGGGNGSATPADAVPTHEHATSVAMLADADASDPPPAPRAPAAEDELPPIGFFFDDGEDALPAKDQSGTFAPDVMQPRAPSAPGEADTDVPAATDHANRDTPDDPGPMPEFDAAATPATAIPPDPDDDGTGPMALPLAWELRGLDTEALDDRSRAALKAAAERLRTLRDDDPHGTGS